MRTINPSSSGSIADDPEPYAGGAVKLLGHELTMPAKYRVGLDDGGHFLQGLLPQLLAMSARALRSPSLNRTRPLIWLRRMRFSVTKYSLRPSSS